MSIFQKSSGDDKVPEVPSGSCDSAFYCGTARPQRRWPGTQASRMHCHRNLLFGPNGSALSAQLQNTSSIGFHAGAFVGVEAGGFVGAIPYLASGGTLGAGAGAGAGAASVAEEAGAAAATAATATRALTAADLGVDAGSLTQLSGTVSTVGTNVTVRVGMIEGSVANPFGVLRSLSTMASAQGATTLTIEASIANPQLLSVLVQRYGAQTIGGIERIVIPLGH